MRPHMQWQMRRTMRGRCQYRVQSSEHRVQTPVSSLSFTALTSELFGVLDRAAGDCTETRHGRCWPRPRKEVVRNLVQQHGAETCRKAAKETREIVQSQDRAPNISALFAKKCADVAAERRADEVKRQSVRDEIRRALA
jgi:hypothetical protein